MGYLTVLYVFFVFFAALFGIVIGSFLNVVIYRVPEGKTISKGITATHIVRDYESAVSFLG